MDRATNKQLMLEDYLRFFDNPSTEALVMDHLNKILSIHGLCRRKTKGEVIEVLKILEVMDPRRSTLKDQASAHPCAPLTLDDVKADVRFLGWEECPLGSVLAVGSAVEKEAATSSKDLSCSNSTAATASTSVPAAPMKKRGRVKKKTAKSVTRLLALADVAASQSTTCVV